MEINGSITKRLYGKQNSLKVLFPWIEYITRLGWIDNNHIFVQVIDRRQTAGAILKISIDAFHSESNLENINLGQGITILFEETSSIWLNIVDIHYFLPDGRLIVSSERTGYRHLYIMSFKANSLNGDVFSTSQISINQLTGGSWCIIDSPISVDESKFLVYFTAKKDTVLENHLYVTSYESNILEIVHEPKSQVGHIIGVDCTFKNDAKVGSVIQADFDFDFKIHRLTNLGFFHKISLNPTCTRFCSVFSNTATLLTCESFEIGFNGEDYTAASTSKVYCPVDSSVVTPKFSSFVNHDGIEINIMTFYPPNFDPSKKYPTILYVYGGPHVQLVTNENKSSRYSNLIFGLELGYAVVIVDGRGSCNRGLMFEGWIKHRMGTVELFDQIDALIFMSRGRCIGKFETVDQAWADLKGQGGWIDTERVVVTGWSYGGYLSLMALCQYPNVFKASIPGAPVTDWLLYDTGYTERYMGLIDENKNGYEKGNVMHYSDGFPCRDALLLVHGMTDENVHFRHTESLVLDLVKKQIPHRIQPFPGERHGLRGKEASAYFEVLKYSFLQDLMKNS